MKIKEKKLKGVFEITLEPHRDDRGFFMRVYGKKIFEEYGINRDWVQENHSRSTKKGIIRGLHFQLPPYTETKLIRTVRGAVFDVFVDLRKDSPTFGKWDSMELSEENKKCVLIPRGFAHGFCNLTDISDVLYKHDNFYSPEYESGILWSDYQLNIPWPVKKPILSRRDQEFMTFNEFIQRHGGLDIQAESKKDE